MSDLTLNAETRTQFGKGAARKIRRDPKIPTMSVKPGREPCTSPSLPTRR